MHSVTNAQVEKITLKREAQKGTERSTIQEPVVGIRQGSDFLL